MNENNRNYLTEEKFDKKFKDGLAEFAEEVLLPAVERIVDYKLEEKLESKLEEKLESKLDEKLNSKFGEFRYELKSYIDDKLADTKGEIIAAIKGEKEKDVKFKEEVVGVFKRNELVDHDKIEQMEALI